MPLPMFPLSTVLFPGVGMPLQIFEPRYLRLIEDLSSAPPYLGVVLITRGSEVGGGDERSSVGTVARISEKVQLENGNWLVLIVGMRPIKIRNWLPDDPYPVALIEEFDDDSSFLGEEALMRIEKKLRYSLLLQGEVSVSKNISPSITLSPKSEEALWQMCAVAPLQLIDQQSLLVEQSAQSRGKLLDSLLDEAISTFELQLSV